MRRIEQASGRFRCGSKDGQDEPLPSSLPFSRATRSKSTSVVSRLDTRLKVIPHCEEDVVDDQVHRCWSQSMDTCSGE